MERLLDFLTDPVFLVVMCCVGTVAAYCLFEKVHRWGVDDATAELDAETKAAKTRAETAVAAKTRAETAAAKAEAEAGRALMREAKMREVRERCRPYVTAGAESARSSMGGAGLMWHEPSAADWTGGDEEKRLERLEKMLKSSGESYEELAPKLGCTPRALRKVRKGKAAMSDERARALYEHFGADAYSVAAFGMTPEEYRAARR